MLLYPYLVQKCKSKGRQTTIVVGVGFGAMKMRSIGIGVLGSCAFNQIQRGD